MMNHITLHAMYINHVLMDECLTADFMGHDLSQIMSFVISWFAKFHR